MTEAVVEVTASIHASTEAVWNALTDPHLVREYFLGAQVSTDWEVGSAISWSGEWGGKAFEDKGEVLVFEPEKRLSFSHWSPISGAEDVPSNYHVVDFVLGADGDHTQVTLAQSNLEGGVTDADRANRDEYEKNWGSLLDGLKKTVESH